MKNTKDAIRYGIETLNVTPKELFSLIESSKGYDGDDYKRWLAARIIDIAEKDDVGFTQLLAKWFNIIQSMIEEYSDDSISEEFYHYIRSMLGSNVYTVGFNATGDMPIEGSDEVVPMTTFGRSADDVEWLKGRDIPWNAEFFDEYLHPNMREDIKNDYPVTLFCHFGKKAGLTKSSDLFLDAKQNGLSCRDNNALMLYRVGSMLNALESQYDGVDFTFAFMADTEFLYCRENQDILNYFLSMFHYDGFVVNSKDLYTESYTSENYAICVCTPRSADEAIQDGFMLRTASLVDNEVVLSEKSNRYSDGGDMLQYLIDTAPECDKAVPMFSRDRSFAGTTRGVSSALGYVCRGVKDRSVFLSSYPVEDTEYFAITDDNIYDVIVYYGLSKSLLHTGMSSGVKEVLSGHPDYMSLVYNCLPLFFFDTDSLFCDHGVVEVGGKKFKFPNKLDVEGSEVAKRLFDEGTVYYAFEAKELLDICKGFLDYLNGEESMVGKTFDEVRRESDNQEMNNMYIRALGNSKGHIASLYRQMMSESGK